VGESQEGWVFDYNKIDRALIFLNVIHPVKLSFGTGLYRYGTHMSVYRHEIRISTYLEMEDANETLWHELVHASQADRLYLESQLPIYQFHKVYNESMGPSGSRYMNNSFEVEARYLADRYKRMALLANPDV